MKPGRTCQICASPDLSLKHDGLLASGLSLIQISRELGVSKYTVSRHGRHSALKISDEDAAKLPADRLDVLYDRCEQLFNSLAAAGDPKAAASVLALQSRLATAAVQREKQQQQTEAEDGDTEKAVTPEQFDRNAEKVHACYLDWIKKFGWVWCPNGCGKPTDPKKIPEHFRTFMEANSGNAVN